MREVEHRGGGEVQPNTPERAAPVHTHLRGLDVCDERAEKRDGDKREVPADDERERRAQQEPGEADGPVEVPQGGSPRRRLGATRSSDPIMDAHRQTATVTRSAATGSPLSSTNAARARNGTVPSAAMALSTRGALIKHCSA